MRRQHKVYEMRIRQLELEIDRLKEIVTLKDIRIGELEKQTIRTTAKLVACEQKEVLAKLGAE